MVVLFLFLFFLFHHRRHRSSGALGTLPRRTLFHIFCQRWVLLFAVAVGAVTAVTAVTAVSAVSVVFAVFAVSAVCYGKQSSCQTLHQAG